MKYYIMTQFQIKGGRWVSRKDILNVLGKRRKLFVKAFTNIYLIFKKKIITKIKKLTFWRF